MGTRALLPLAACCAILAAAPPTSAEPAAASGLRRGLAAQRELFELGVYLGAFFPAANHELYDFPSVRHRELERAACEGGLRVGYLPQPWWGVEGEAGVMPSAATNGESANL